MKKRRFFHAELPQMETVLALCRDITQHIRVLRIQVGEQLLLFDGRGHFSEATVKEINEQTTICVVGPAQIDSSTSIFVQPVSDLEIQTHLVQALPKGKKLDTIIRMCTEVGVNEIHPVWTEHAVPQEKTYSRNLNEKAERWKRIAKEASRQSLRTSIPQVHAPKYFADIFSIMPQEKNILYGCPHEGKPLSDIASQNFDSKSTWIFIGPEGGWSKKEISEFKNQNACSISISKHTLRTETAAVVSCALLIHQLNAQNKI